MVPGDSAVGPPGLAGEGAWSPAGTETGDTETRDAGRQANGSRRCSPSRASGAAGPASC